MLLNGMTNDASIQFGELRAARTLPLPDVKIFKETKKDQK